MHSHVTFSSPFDECPLEALALTLKTQQTRRGQTPQIAFLHPDNRLRLLITFMPIIK